MDTERKDYCGRLQFLTDDQIIFRAGEVCSTLLRTEQECLNEPDKARRISLATDVYVREIGGDAETKEYPLFFQLL